MARFKDLGFKSFEDYVRNFFDTLLPSNKTYEYFVDWKKVKAEVNKYLDELSLLNSLTKIDAEKRVECNNRGYSPSYSREDSKWENRCI